MKASKKKWNEIYTYHSLTKWLIYLYWKDRDLYKGKMKEMGIKKRLLNFYFTFEYEETGFKGKIKLWYNGISYSIYVKIKNKWVYFDDYDWDVK